MIRITTAAAGPGRGQKAGEAVGVAFITGIEANKPVTPCVSISHGSELSAAIEAVITGLATLKEATSVEIHTHRIIVNTMNPTTRRKKRSNFERWKRLEELAGRHTISWKTVEQTGLAYIRALSLAEMALSLKKEEISND